MAANAEPRSVTPILDLSRPLPEPDTEQISGRFAFPFLTAVAAIVLTGNLSFLTVLFSFVVINFLTIAIHELGHLAAGWCVGLRFQGVRIDPFRIRIDSGKWKFKIRPRLFWGYALMGLDRVRRVRTRLIVLTAGGPAASILCGLAAVVAGEIGLARYDSAWPTFLDFLGVWSLAIGCMGLFPFSVHGFANDAMLLRALLFSKSEATQLFASYALATVKNKSFFAPDYVRRWFRVAGTPTRLPVGNYYANWLAYENAQDNEVAAQYLELCLASSAWMDDDPRDVLVAEAAFFTAWRRDDAAKAEVWRKRIKSPDRLHPLSLCRTKIALLCANKQFDSAKTELEGALLLILQETENAGRPGFEAGWLSWGEQIQARIREVA